MLRRLFYCFLTLGGISPILALKPVVPTKPTSNYNVYIEPLSTTRKSSRVLISLPALADLKITTNVYIVNDLYPDGILIASGTASNRKTSKVVTYDNRYTRGNNKIRIETVSASGKTSVIHDAPTLKTGSFTITSSNKTVIEPCECLAYETGLFSLKKYSYTFTNFDSAYSPDYYHFYSPKSCKVTTNSPFSFSNAEIDLYLTNREGVFDDMPIEDEYMVLPLSIGTKGTLQLKEKYYVDPLTLKMSSESKPNYVETSYLYLPKNEMRYQGEYEGIIRFSDFGSAHSKVIYQFTFNALSNIMGDCVNSEFCVLNNKTKLS